MRRRRHSVVAELFRRRPLRACRPGRAALTAPPSPRRPRRARRPCRPPLTLCHGDSHLENIFFGDHFEGGRLIFHDGDADRRVEPTPGLLVAFASGAAPVVEVHEKDRGSAGLARACFQALYPRLEVRIMRVFEVVPV